MRCLLLPALLLTALASPAAPPQKPSVAYYCASGWRVKYHTSPRCWGLRHCNSRVEPLPLAQVRQRRMQSCGVCH